jgi:hypothetical protein
MARNDRQRKRKGAALAQAVHFRGVFCHIWLTEESFKVSGNEEWERK